MVVHPFTCFLSAVLTAQTFHPLYKTIQLGSYLLESPFFKADDFHCLYHFQLNIYIQNSGKGQVFYSQYAIMYHRPILGWKYDRFILFPLQIKAVEITLQ